MGAEWEQVTFGFCPNPCLSFAPGPEPMVLTLPPPTRAISGGTTGPRLSHRNPYFVGAAILKARQDGRLDWLAIEEHPLDA